MRAMFSQNFRTNYMYAAYIVAQNPYSLAFHSALSHYCIVRYVIHVVSLTRLTYIAAPMSHRPPGLILVNRNIAPRAPSRLQEHQPPGRILVSLTQILFPRRFIWRLIIVSPSSHYCAVRYWRHLSHLIAVIPFDRYLLTSGISCNISFGVSFVLYHISDSSHYRIVRYVIGIVSLS